MATRRGNPLYILIVLLVVALVFYIVYSQGWFSPPTASPGMLTLPISR